MRQAITQLRMMYKVEKMTRKFAKKKTETNLCNMIVYGWCKQSFQWRFTQAQHILFIGMVDKTRQEKKYGHIR